MSEAHSKPLNGTTTAPSQQLLRRRRRRRGRVRRQPRWVSYCVAIGGLALWGIVFSSLLYFKERWNEKTAVNALIEQQRKKLEYFHQQNMKMQEVLTPSLRGKDEPITRTY